MVNMCKMYLIFAVLATIANIFVTAAPNFWIEQKLDQFNNSDNRIFRMRYHSIDRFYKPGGPIFIMIGGAWPIKFSFIDEGSHIYNLAGEHNAYLFSLEHRFYGKSKPFRKMTTEQLKYLNTKQVLADIANFIRTVKDNLDGMENSKVILVGCAYAGALATWFKKLYPDLVTGVWASSAPLLAKADFHEEKELIGQVIKKLGGAACYNRIKNSIAKVESLFNDNNGAEVKELFELCGEFDRENDLDVFSLFHNIFLTFNDLLDARPKKIRKSCKKIMSKNSDLLGLVYYFKTKMNKLNGCRNVSYAFDLKFIKSSTLIPYIRQWNYQLCNEFGWFPTTNSTNQPFGTKNPLSFFATRCADAFGSQFTEEYIMQKVKETNEMFGGLNPGVENVYFTQFATDPFKAIGIHNGKIIPDCNYCTDLLSIQPRDSATLISSKETIAARIKKWLS